ncbi:Maf family protein [Agriterribacter sp.]|uniref:Maf family protein n=1 Tax=Agriterribacter sp. TaxID=2821509 RepID=UPI002B77815F|nr:Maf family protein [Agriterribacter sp.]HRP57684.1 Maf family protein [Agriterribacter sp.]
MKKIVLASRSPRRKQLLEWAEVEFDIIAEATDESFPRQLHPKEAAIHIALQKALAVQVNEVYKRYEQHMPVLAADTIVVCEGKIIGKPADREDAIGILHKLSGKKHEVITGVAIINGKEEKTFADITEVWFHALTPEQITFYVEKYKPYDKAGAYAIQEWIGVVGIERINGDFYNVMGLPVSRVVRELEDLIFKI